MGICGVCGDKLADHLRAVADLHQDLAVTYARLDVLTVSAGRGGEHGLPFTAAAIHASESLTAVVVYWAQQVAFLRASVWQIPDSLAGIAHWLAMRLDWLRALEAAGEAYNQLDRAVIRARAVIDRPAHRTSFPVGPCPELRNSRYCLGAVFAYVPAVIGDTPAVMRCREPECRRHREPWTTDMWLGAGRRIIRLQQQLAARGIVSRPCGDDPGRGAAFGGG